jgi:uncharacterized protein
MSRAPGHADGELVPCELSRTGTLWSYTNAGYQPPEPFIAPPGDYKPFSIAAVELDVEKIVVMGMCSEGITPQDLEVGTPMELVLDTLYSDDENDYLVWKWQPVGWVPTANTAADTAAATGAA